MERPKQMVEEQLRCLSEHLHLIHVASGLCILSNNLGNQSKCRSKRKQCAEMYRCHGGTAPQRKTAWAVRLTGRVTFVAESGNISSGLHEYKSSNQTTLGRTHAYRTTEPKWRIYRVYDCHTKGGKKEKPSALSPTFASIHLCSNDSLPGRQDLLSAAVIKKLFTDSEHILPPAEALITDVGASVPPCLLLTPATMLAISLFWAPSRDQDVCH